MKLSKLLRLLNSIEKNYPGLDPEVVSEGQHEMFPAEGVRVATIGAGAGVKIVILRKDGNL